MWSLHFASPALIKFSLLLLCGSTLRGGFLGSVASPAPMWRNKSKKSSSSHRESHHDLSTQLELGPPGESPEYSHGQGSSYNYEQPDTMNYQGGYNIHDDHPPPINQHGGYGQYPGQPALMDPWMNSLPQEFLQPTNDDHVGSSHQVEENNEQENQEEPFEIYRGQPKKTLRNKWLRLHPGVAPPLRLLEKYELVAIGAPQSKKIYIAARYYEEKMLKQQRSPFWCGKDLEPYPKKRRFTGPLASTYKIDPQQRGDLHAKQAWIDKVLGENGYY